MSASSATAPWANRIVDHGEESPESLLPNPANWRQHGAVQRQALTDVLGEVGLVQSVIVNRTSGHLVDGHLRVELAKSQGQPTIPVVYVELSEEEEHVILASLDPIAALASADREKLAELLSGIENEDLADLVEAIARENRIALDLGSSVSRRVHADETTSRSTASSEATVRMPSMTTLSARMTPGTPSAHSCLWKLAALGSMMTRSGWRGAIHLR